MIPEKKTLGLTLLVAIAAAKVCGIKDRGSFVSIRWVNSCASSNR